MKTKENGKCCLCKGRYTHYGNNPAHLMFDTGKKSNRCCDDCNFLKVIPERLRQMGIKTR